MSIITDVLSKASSVATPYILYVKIAVISVILTGCAYYVWDTQRIIAKDDNLIISLRAAIVEQNSAIIAAKNDRLELEARLADEVANNDALQKQNGILAAAVAARPKSATCDAAIQFLNGTQKRLAIEWNSPK